MLHQWLRRLFGHTSSPVSEIAPDEIFLDARNLPELDEAQFEGRLERPVSGRSIAAVGLACLLVCAVFTARAWGLQVVEGEAYAIASEQNHLRHTILFAERGVIYDRNGVELAWNAPNDRDAFSMREYTDLPGFGHVLGFVSYPSRDASGFFYREDFVGKDGVEGAYDELLGGENGKRLIEINAVGDIVSENVISPPYDGESLSLSIDADLESALYEKIKETAESSGFQGGAGVIMDVATGELLAAASFPEFSPDVVSNDTNSSTYQEYVEDPRSPFLDRVVSGLYTPGSIVKPFMALAALEEGVITPEKKILSTGSISVPNPYDPAHPSVFRDWKAHGWVDMREAIAVSSDVYFYEVGGGFEGQPGLGIERIDEYMHRFGFGEPTGVALLGEQDGVIPTPEWKAEHFDGEQWFLGDTYHTAIGQYGFQVTPLQVVRAIAAIANGGTLLSPSLLSGGERGTKSDLALDPYDLTVVREGMRASVDHGTALGLSVPYVAIGGKTGTAEVGAHKEYINSWTAGFFPYAHPRYAFVVLMERGKAGTTIGAVYAMRQMLDWMHANAPEYFKDAE